MAEGDSGSFTLPVERVLEDRNFNTRIFFGDIDRLAIELMTEGQREPIDVREEHGQFFVVDGRRRRSALLRSDALRIEKSRGRYLAYDGAAPVREAPGPVHPAFAAGVVRCRLARTGATEEELAASQLAANRGKPFTLLERMLCVSRLMRRGAPSLDDLALKAGFSRTHLANARSLNAADPRMIEYVRDGRMSQKLALRLLRALPAERQVDSVCAAMAKAGRHHRRKLLPKDFDWAGESAAGHTRSGSAPGAMDPVRARLADVVARLGEELPFAPNPTAADRLGTLIRIHRFATGQLSYAKLEAHLLGRA